MAVALLMAGYPYASSGEVLLCAEFQMLKRWIVFEFLSYGRGTVKLLSAGRACPTFGRNRP